MPRFGHIIHATPRNASKWPCPASWRSLCLRYSTRTHAYSLKVYWINICVLVVSNHSSLKNCAELQFACLWHTNMHTWCIHCMAYMLYMVSETQKGGNMGEHQGSPGIIPPKCHGFWSSLSNGSPTSRDLSQHFCNCFRMWLLLPTCLQEQPPAPKDDGHRWVSAWDHRVSWTIMVPRYRNVDLYHGLSWSIISYL